MPCTSFFNVSHIFDRNFCFSLTLSEIIERFSNGNQIKICAKIEKWKITTISTLRCADSICSHSLPFSQFNFINCSSFCSRLFSQRAHSNRMHCSYQKDVSSIIYITLRDAGLLFDGIKLERPPAKTVACKWEALQCCYHAAFHCFLALNLSAVQNISKVSRCDDINAIKQSRCSRVPHFFYI